MNNPLNHYKNEEWVIAVSGGPDSMALLAMSQQAGVRLHVVHVNYHKRESALRDQRIVSDFCELYKIDLKIMDAPASQPGNFQDFARRFRYEQFKLRCEETQSIGVMTAHHQDDVLETYLMQKQRKSQVDFFGLKSEVTIYHVKVLRPLLSYTKQQLIDYCAEFKISYGIDESNNSLNYTRNRIRQLELAKMTETDKRKLFDQMNNDNLNQEKLIRELSGYIESDRITLKEYTGLSQEQRYLFLSMWLRSKAHVKIVSHNYLAEIDRQIASVDSLTIPLSRDVSFIKQYEQLFLIHEKALTFEMKFEKIEYVSTQWFGISPVGPLIEALTLTEEDFPITIRNARAGDSITLRFGRKKIARWMIDRKIPSVERRSWPVVVNAKGDVIFVAGIGSDIAHYSNNPSIFVVK